MNHSRNYTDLLDRMNIPCDFQCTTDQFPLMQLAARFVMDSFLLKIQLPGKF